MSSATRFPPRTIRLAAYVLILGVAVLAACIWLFAGSTSETTNDAYVTADMKYHEFFDANGRMMIADIGHFESEQFTINLLHEVLEQKFLNFAVLKTEVDTNPVHYF